MNTLKIAYQHIQFGKVSIVDTHELDPDYIPPPAEFVAGESSIDTSAIREVTQDDTAEFERAEREPVYLKLPIPAWVVSLWIRFDEWAGVKYR